MLWCEKGKKKLCCWEEEEAWMLYAGIYNYMQAIAIIGHTSTLGKWKVDAKAHDVLMIAKPTKCCCTHEATRTTRGDNVKWPYLSCVYLSVCVRVDIERGNSKRRLLSNKSKRTNRWKHFSEFSMCGRMRNSVYWDAQHICADSRYATAFRNLSCDCVGVDLLCVFFSVACNDFMMINDKIDDGWWSQWWWWWCWWLPMTMMMMTANDDDCESRWSKTYDFHEFFTPSPDNSSRVRIWEFRFIQINSTKKSSSILIRKMLLAWYWKVCMYTYLLLVTAVAHNLFPI